MFAVDFFFIDFICVINIFCLFVDFIHIFISVVFNLFIDIIYLITIKVFAIFSFIIVWLTICDGLIFSGFVSFCWVFYCSVIILSYFGISVIVKGLTIYCILFVCYFFR